MQQFPPNWPPGHLSPDVRLSGVEEEKIIIIIIGTCTVCAWLSGALAYCTTSNTLKPTYKGACIKVKGQLCVNVIF